MLILFIDSVSGEAIAVNPERVETVLSDKNDVLLTMSNREEYVVVGDLEPVATRINCACAQASRGEIPRC